MRKLPSGEKLARMAIKLGVKPNRIGPHGLIEKKDDDQLQKDIPAFKKYRRESHAWIIPLLSGIGGIIAGAVAAIKLSKES